MEDGILLFGRAETWGAVLTLVSLLVVLDIDNVVFMSILSSKLPQPGQRKRALQLGLAMGLGLRLGLLTLVSFLTQVENTLFSLQVGGWHYHATVRSLLLLGGGLFLLAKGTLEIHDKLEGPEHRADGSPTATRLGAVLLQILVIDIVFSVDSVLTAVGLTNQLPVMLVSILLSYALLLAAAGVISRYVQRHPTLKMLALAFLLLIGLVLFTEGLHVELPKGYVYSAMAFALGVEILNIQFRRISTAPLRLRGGVWAGSAHESGPALYRRHRRLSEDPLATEAELMQQDPEEPQKD